MIDWVELSRAVPYAGTAIIFGIFMVLILRESAKQHKEEAQLQDKKDERRDNNFLLAIERRDQDWRDFLAAQTTARGEQWSAVVGELKGLTAIVTLSAGLLRDHDSWERGLLSTLQMRRIGDAPATPHLEVDARVDIAKREEDKK